MSHGTQDQYPTFLKEQHHASANPAVLVAVIYNLGALRGGGFVMQFLVQGAWDVIPAHLSELPPDEIRSFYAGVIYKLGNLLAAINLPLQTRLADHYDENFGLGIAIVVVPVLILTALVTWLGSENRGASSARSPRRRTAAGPPCRSPARRPPAALEGAANRRRDAGDYPHLGAWTLTRSEETSSTTRGITVRCLTTSSR
jgi:MFS transporter, SHS family, lactate transporter